MLTQDYHNRMNELRDYRGILNDAQITLLSDAVMNPRPMLDPFVGHQVSRININEAQGDAEEVWKRILSYGVSAYGYDTRLAPLYKVFTNAANDGGIIDPLDFKEDVYLEKDGPSCVIPPNSYILGHTIEYFRMPDDVIALCLGKSTYARCGIAVNVTPIEPGWEGHVTLEISNQTPLPIRVHAHMGICQFVFFKGVRPDTTYGDKGGKYMRQTGITPPKV